MKASGTTTQPATAGIEDEAGNWFPENLAQIEARLDDIEAGNSTGRPVAVFDFDNTCIFRDVGQAVFRYQLLHLRYRITPEQLAQILPAMDGELAGRPMAAVVALLIDTYRQLWPLIADNRQDEARLLPAFRLFVALLLWFTDQARKDGRLGPPYVLPFMGKMLAGFPVAGLGRFAVEVVTAVMAEPLTEETLEIDAPQPIGRIRASFPLGLHVHPEMSALMRTLQARHIESYVISASTEWLVAGAAKLLGFPVTADRIFGIRVEVDAQGHLTIDDPAGYPVTFRGGKAEVIRRFIDGSPILVAGDADTDFEMLTMPDVAIRLLINRKQKGLISSLYQDPRILLQGLDLRTGRFRPSRESIEGREGE